jgi:pimeloyl-ACP methyl ester carboxylesterase
VHVALHKRSSYSFSNDLPSCFTASGCLATGAAILTLYAVCVLSLCADAGAVSSETDPRPLSRLVHEFLETEDADHAKQVLSEILKNPQADPTRVETIIRAGLPYGARPVGMQAEVPIRVRNHTYRYGLYVPLSYRPTKDYALVICLHGAGFTGDAYLERWQARLGDDYILACPTFGEGAWWTGQAEELVLATIRAVQARYRIDPDRIFLTGMSNGGIGAWIIGSHHASRFAGLSPMASGLDQVLYPFLENLRHTPIYLIHGLKDQVMPVELSRSIAKELTRLGYAFVYREHDRVHSVAGGHYFPREELPELVAWFDARRREPFPKKVTVVRDATHLVPFGWVRIDATDRIAALSENLTDSRDETIINRIYAKLDAEIAAPNRVEVRTQRVRRYSLFLNHWLVDLSKPITVVTDGRLSYEGPVAPSVETLLRESRTRQDRHMLFPVLLSLSVEDQP